MRSIADSKSRLMTLVRRAIEWPSLPPFTLLGLPTNGTKVEARASLWRPQFGRYCVQLDRAGRLRPTILRAEQGELDSEEERS